MRRVLADITPLRVSRNYRLLFIGQLVSNLGSQVSIVAVAFEVYRLTHSSLQVGLVSLVQLVPLLLVAVLGGPLIDRHDRRKILVLCFITTTLLGVGLIVDTHLTVIQLWPFYLFPALQSGIQALSTPTQNSATPDMVPPTLVKSAIALRQVIYQTGAVVGPTIAGIIIASFGVSVAFIVDAASFAFVLLTTVLMSPLPPAHRTKEPDILRGTALRQIQEGFTFIRGSKVVQGIYLADLNAMVFGLPRALFPALALRQFHAGAAGLGYIYSAVGLGAMLAAFSTGWVTSLHHQGRTVVLAVMLWGASMVFFGYTDALWIGIVLLAIAGYADVVSAVLRNSMLQATVPPELFGRLSAIQFAVVSGGPRLGDLESGAVATIFSDTISVVSGGLLCVVGVATLAVLNTSFSRFPPPTRQERSLET